MFLFGGTFSLCRLIDLKGQQMNGLGRIGIFLLEFMIQTQRFFGPPRFPQLISSAEFLFKLDEPFLFDSGKAGRPQVTGSGQGGHGHEINEVGREGKNGQKVQDGQTAPILFFQHGVGREIRLFFFFHRKQLQ